MFSQDCTLHLADERSLMYFTCGDPNGIPVFYFHGSGVASGYVAKALDETAASLHIRIIAPDRPGMGGSSSKPGRRLTDWQEDVASLADFLKIDTFCILCESGGAAYAYACALKMAERVRLISVVSGLIPLDLPVLQKGAPLSKRLSTRLGRAMMTNLPGFMIKAMLKNMHLGVQKDPAAFFLKSFQKAPEAEKQYFQTQKNRDLFSSVILHTFQNGYSGAVTDMRICLGKWNLPVEKLSIPIQLYHGKMDKTVPVEFAENMSRYLNNCNARYYPKETHLSLLPSHANEILSAIQQECGYLAAHS